MNGKFYENVEEVLKDCSIYELAIAKKLIERKKERIETSVFSRGYLYQLKKKEELEKQAEEDPYAGFKLSWDINDWSNFSSNPQPEKDIRRRAIIDTLYNNEMICMAYIAQHTQLSLEFIKELLYICSPFFDFKYYNTDCINWYSEFLNSDKRNRRKIIRGYLEGKTPFPNDNVKEFILFISDKVLKRSWLNYSKLDIFTLLEYQNIGYDIYKQYEKFIESTIKVSSSGRTGNTKFKTLVKEVKAFGCSRYAPLYYSRKKKVMLDPIKKKKAISILGKLYFQLDSNEDEYDALQD